MIPQKQVHTQELKKKIVFYKKKYIISIRSKHEYSILNNF